MAGRTQIIVQWLDDTRPSIFSLFSLRIVRLEGVLKRNSQSLYEIDGHDIGSGTLNIVLYSNNCDAAVRRIIEIYDAGKLRPGMRIGVAEYKNAERTDWYYRPAYPPGLTNFDNSY